MMSLKSVPDDDLLRELARLVTQSRGIEADLVAHIGEVELRRLYAREACSSMFEYCRRILLLRENEAYLRITVARAAREHPVLLEMLQDGRLHLSGIARLTPHITRENAANLLERASGMSYREIRELAAELEPKPDVAATIRKLPERSAPASRGLLQPRAPACQLGAHRVEFETVKPEPSSRVGSEAGKLESSPRFDSDAIKLESRPGEFRDPQLEHKAAVPARRALVEPLAPGRYQVRFTASLELREKLERLQALMRSSVPDGDLARIMEIAVSEKLERVEAKRFGRTKAPRSDPADADTSASSRHIPAAVRRLVYERDGGRCAFKDKYDRRCSKRHDLEFHHERPFALGGDHSPGNLALMCRTHNNLLAEQDYGEDVMARFRAATTRAAVPVEGFGARMVVQPRRIASG
jgi:hypothetical protein